MKLTEMKTNAIREPLGFALDPLTLQWQLEPESEADEKAQVRSARVVIRRGGSIVYDSGEMTGETADGRDFCPALQLEPRTAYQWQVCLQLDNGTEVSAESRFETGKMQEPWQGRWISTPLDKKTPPVFSRAVQLRQKPVRARAYVCGLGLYEMYIGGRKAGDEFLAPGYHSYDRHLQVQTYDVTDMLKDGENSLSFLLGDGWFKGRLGFDGGWPDLYGDTYSLIYEIHADYADGSSEVIASDGTETAVPSPIVSCSIYDGEICDSRIPSPLTTNLWKAADETEDQNQETAEKAAISTGCTVLLQAPAHIGPLCDRMSPPVVKKQEFEVKELIRTPAGETVLDFGQNMTGWVEADVDLPAGVSLTLTAAEILQNGNFYHDNMRIARTEFVYISDDRPAHVRPHFTFYGFRYMKAETSDGSPVKAADFRAFHLRSDNDQIGQITTGNPELDRLFQNVLWSQNNNSLDIPTDCPQRDERLGWTGDAQIFSDTACFNMDMTAFYRKYLWDMRAEQETRGGETPNTVPCIHKPMIGDGGSSPWADSAVIIPWNVYRHSGNRSFLAEFYPGMKGWVEFERRKEEAQGEKHLIQGGFHFGDWLALDNDVPGPFGKTDTQFIVNAYYFHCTEILSKAAQILDYAADAADYRVLAEKIRSTLLAKWFDADGLCTIDTQTAAAMTIMFGLNPPAKQAQGDVLSSMVRRNRDHLNTGFIGTSMLCAALSETGHHEQAVTLLLNEDYPGWLYAVKLGATTIWERWNSVLPDGSMNSEGMNSLDHYSYGAIEAFVYQYVCGIRIEDAAAGFRTVIIEPKPDRRIPDADGSIRTPYGIVRCAYRTAENGMVRYSIAVPYGTTARVMLPGREEQILHCGNYEF
jgi:alpha-L-rhamnosidase